MKLQRAGGGGGGESSGGVVISSNFILFFWGEGRRDFRLNSALPSRSVVLLMFFSTLFRLIFYLCLNR